MELKTLQDVFQRFVLADAHGIEDQIDPGRHSNHHRRLRIYYDAYRLRLAEALATDHPALQAVMGPDAFRAMCLAYVDATPSPWRNVRWYGGELADFLSTTSPWNAQPALGECARFEWALTLAFDAADVEPLTFEALAGMSAEAWSDLRLELHPSVQLIRLHCNAGALRTAADDASTLPPLAWSDDPVDWLIWRQGDSVRFRSLPGLESIAFHSARNGDTFPELCASLLDYVEEAHAAAHAAGFLRRWVDDAVIARIA